MSQEVMDALADAEQLRMAVNDPAIPRMPHRNRLRGRLELVDAYYSETRRFMRVRCFTVDQVGCKAAILADHALRAVPGLRGEEGAR